MSMKHLTSTELLARTKNLVQEERRATLALIEHLAEIERRRLYAELGFASLWEFATQELGLSEGAAQRRLQAARLLQDVPEAKTKLKAGTLSLSNAAKIQSFRQAERKMGRKPDPRKLIAAVEFLSQRQCEAKLYELSPEALPREKERIVSQNSDRELTLVVSPELYEKLKRIQGLIAHSHPNATYAELLEYLADQQLKLLEEQKGIQEATAAAAVAPSKHPELPAGKRVYLPQSVKKAVWARSRGQCEYEREGRRCTSRHFLQIDHRTPLALGGANDLSNLRILCRNHNLQQARETLEQERAHDCPDQLLLVIVG